MRKLLLENQIAATGKDFLWLDGKSVAGWNNKTRFFKKGSVVPGQGEK